MIQNTPIANTSIIKTSVDEIRAIEEKVSVSNIAPTSIAIISTIRHTNNMVKSIAEIIIVRIK